MRQGLKWKVMIVNRLVPAIECRLTATSLHHVLRLAASATSIASYAGIDLSDPWQNWNSAASEDL